MCQIGMRTLPSLIRKALSERNRWRLKIRASGGKDHRAGSDATSQRQPVSPMAAPLPRRARRDYWIVPHQRPPHSILDPLQYLFSLPLLLLLITSTLFTLLGSYSFSPYTSPHQCDQRRDTTMTLPLPAPPRDCELQCSPPSTLRTLQRTQHSPLRHTGGHSRIWRTRKSHSTHHNSFWLDPLTEAGLPAHNTHHKPEDLGYIGSNIFLTEQLYNYRTALRRKLQLTLESRAHSSSLHRSSRTPEKSKVKKFLYT